jgi:hypothetical protein
MKDTVILVTHYGMGNTQDAPELPVKLINKYFGSLGFAVTYRHIWRSGGAR